MSFSEDFSPFFGDFADAALLDGQPVQGIYDAPYTVGMQSGPGMAGELPTFMLPSASVPEDWERKLLVIESGKGVGNYTVREHQPDGTGISTLSLQVYG